MTKSRINNYYYFERYNERMAKKKTLDIQDKQIIKNEFCSWILGVEEDDPLDPEISTICFTFSFENCAVNLQYSGFEFVPIVMDYGSYSPLEAQHFDCVLLNVFSNNSKYKNKQGKIQEQTKQQIFAMFEEWLKSFQNKQEYDFLNGKKIFFGEFLKEKSRSFVFN